eukprot:TRINITY_DN7482_c0_g1_i1.p1 TRINITY_DN7482_c0_g1~~TRINITY_DN7482_c0_g1_i1.p1  ORF type:complete len:457 (+),score=68.31 TRINITY_DN7482_c0_g1_i1:68-1438(+)
MGSAPPQAALATRLLVGLSLLSSLLYAGIIFGWTPLQQLLIRDGAFAELCPSPAVTTLHAGHPQTTTMCAARVTALARLYGVCSALLSLSGMPCGFVVDALPPPVTAACAGAAVVLSLYLIGAGSAAALWTGFVILPFGGMTGYLLSFKAVHLAPAAQRATLASASSTFFDASACVFLLLRAAAVSQGWSLREATAGFAACSVAFYSALTGCWVAVLAHSARGAEGSPLLPAEQGAAVGAVRALPFSRQVRTAEFLIQVAWLAIGMLLSNQYLGESASFLHSLGARGPRLPTEVAAIIPLGVLVVPLVGRAIAVLGFGRAAHVVNGLCIAYLLVMLTVPVNFQPVGAVIFTCYRAFLYSHNSAFAEAVFGPRTSGRVIGALCSLASLPSFLQPVFAHLAVAGAEGSPDAPAAADWFLPNLIQLALSPVMVALSCLLLAKSREPAVHRPPLSQADAP